MLSATIENLLNRALPRSPRARQLCAQLAGRSLAVVVRDILSLRVSSNGVTLDVTLASTASDAMPAEACQSPVWDTALALLALTGAAAQAPLQRGEVLISGDTHIAEQFRELARLLQPLIAPSDRGFERVRRMVARPIARESPRAFVDRAVHREKLVVKFNRDHHVDDRKVDRRKSVVHVTPVDDTTETIALIEQEMASIEIAVNDAQRACQWRLVDLESRGVELADRIVGKPCVAQRCRIDVVERAQETPEIAGELSPILVGKVARTRAHTE